MPVANLIMQNKVTARTLHKERRAAAQMFAKRPAAQAINHGRARAHLSPHMSSHGRGRPKAKWKTVIRGKLCESVEPNLHVAGGVVTRTHSASFCGWLAAHTRRLTD